MAKKKKKAARLPKHIAGVKIPKAIRKSGGVLLQQANTPLGRELIAAGLVAAGAALAKKDDLRRAARATADEAEDAAELGARMAGQIGGVVAAAANTALDRLFGKTASEESPEPPTPTAH
ncbi:MAG TPA: hypothetical protein VFT56_06915 [Sphingomonas sp.]|nr:hypothetical protein [Sphingomonas sp.]